MHAIAMGASMRYPRLVAILGLMPDPPGHVQSPISQASVAAVLRLALDPEAERKIATRSLPGGMKIRLDLPFGTVSGRTRVKRMALSRGVEFIVRRLGCASTSGQRPRPTRSPQDRWDGAADGCLCGGTGGSPVPFFNPVRFTAKRMAAQAVGSLERSRWLARDPGGCASSDAHAVCRRRHSRRLVFGCMDTRHISRIRSGTVEVDVIDDVASARGGGIQLSFGFTHHRIAGP